ncbi:EcoRII N-terminal effector-binding domain-containing protein [Cupriavidus sp. SK-4]|uniref:EcoRII N-terminal effector-binding domain-containing protein n=1 Tax=Cupriavidus sp. SK-4 TaxID=574750 RepID=UPI000A058249|nr:EcoRII N-terminal effector-binding domain-containing protein [Cupriavidus sp. SK-4]
MKKTFSKTLSANDVGATGTHQAGILVPKSQKELLEFLPPLDANIKNPDAWIECQDEDGTVRRFRFVYYNNKLHDDNGTRNEYRITYMTSYFRDIGAREGEVFEISQKEGDPQYTIRVTRPQEASSDPLGKDDALRIKLSSVWRRVH